MPESTNPAPDRPRVVIVGAGFGGLSAARELVPTCTILLALYHPAVILRRISGKPALPPFRYRSQGNLATIGRSCAVADFGWLRLSGYPAWALWCVAHVFFLISLRNRMVVCANWAWNYMTFERGARLIIGMAVMANTGPAMLRKRGGEAGPRSTQSPATLMTSVKF